MGLADHAPTKYNSSGRLIRIGCLWGTVFLVIGLPLAYFVIGIPLLAETLILYVFGTVGAAILSFQLASDTEIGGLEWAGALFLVTIILPMPLFMPWLILLGSVWKMRGQQGSPSLDNTP